MPKALKEEEEKSDIDIDIVFKNKENRIVYGLLCEMVRLKAEAKNTCKECDKRKYKNYFDGLIKKFSYIPELHARKYINYPNYQDLLQEGLLGLVVALNKFDMNRSNNFYQLANWYVKTRITRAANKFDVINVPISLGKEGALHRVSICSGYYFGETEDPNEDLERSEIMKQTISFLPGLHKKVFCYYHGVDLVNNEIVYAKQFTVADISKNLNISQVKVKKILCNTNKRLASLLT